MARSKSSDRWLKEHFADTYVKQAQREGFRSRAVYKLKEIQDKDHVLRPGMTVVDLGAAPGGWSQYAAQVTGGRGRIVALDILPMDPLPDVDFLQGDFRDDAVLAALLKLIDAQAVDLVMSDMAPNISGMDAVDQPRAIYLCELALELAHKVLKPGGDLLMKAFQGQGFDELHAELRRGFERVVVRKPQASRPRSREVYLLARGMKLV